MKLGNLTLKTSEVRHQRGSPRSHMSRARKSTRRTRTRKGHPTRSYGWNRKPSRIRITGPVRGKTWAKPTSRRRKNSGWKIHEEIETRHHYVFTRSENLPRDEGVTAEGEDVVDGTEEEEEGVKRTPCCGETPADELAAEEDREPGISSTKVTSSDMAKFTFYHSKI